MSGYSAAPDPIDTWADILSTLEKTVHELGRRAEDADTTKRGLERARLRLLYVHAVVALLVGPGYAAVGRDGMTGGTWVLLRQIPGAPYSTGIWLTVGGVILLIGTIRIRRRLELTGLSMLFVWYVTIFAGYVGANILWYAEGALATRPTTFAHWIYGGWAVFNAIHWITVWRTMRAENMQ